MPYKDPKRKRKRSLDWSIKKRIEAIQLLGIECHHCGLRPSNPIEINLLEFHHSLNNKTNSNSCIDALKRVKGMQLLCRNCHRLADIKMGVGKKPFTRHLSNQKLVSVLNIKRLINSYRSNIR